MENNISRKLDFETLVAKYPRLGRYFNGAKYDFHNNDAVIAITEVLLKEWGLTVHIHSDRLCPRLFNRLDYLEFMRNLLGSWDDHVGLDVGTGHLAIYALLGAKLFDLQFIGTDIDEESLELARAIVVQNNLQEKIQLVLTRQRDPLFRRLVELLGSRNGFVMCNPPFYSSFEEMEKRAEMKADPRFPRAAANELVIEGGEVAFVQNATRAPVHARQAAGADQWAGECGADQKSELGHLGASGRRVVASLPPSTKILGRSGSGSAAARKPDQSRLEERL
ncbi:hypothetical protein KL933_004975 [Ogataea haglerorum]|uniref:Uncharacterized protein n=1 Tax=Ogataea haglerorum TaxID=1937702 RepID=A0AAN6D295_9ASCO|nr:hypothetical protein KL933_004975 [Ogataea haglerorum]KAG7725400.1 hypothetical protein KL948_004961 [Ogataea haglerorum]